MIGRRAVGVALIGGILLFGLRAALMAPRPPPLAPIGSGERAPEFRLSLLGGGEFTLSPAPRVTLIDFWATWCGPCRQELPHLDALWRRYRDRGVRLVAVDVEGREAIPKVEAFAREAGLTLPIALDGTGVAEAYRVDELPHLVVVDGTGRIRRVLLGEQDESGLAAVIDEALKN